MSPRRATHQRFCINVKLEQSIDNWGWRSFLVEWPKLTLFGPYFGLGMSQHHLVVGFKRACRKAHPCAMPIYSDQWFLKTSGPRARCSAAYWTKGILLFDKSCKWPNWTVFTTISDTEGRSATCWWSSKQLVPRHIPVIWQLILTIGLNSINCLFVKTRILYMFSRPNWAQNAKFRLWSALWND